MSRARVMIVDDHPLVRFGLKEMISDQLDLEVCGLAASASEALALVAESVPDLLLIDLSLADRSGLELIKEIRARKISAPILVNSMHSEKRFAQRVLKAGANGFISKDEDTEELTRAIRKVLRGEVYLSEEMTQHLLQVTAGADPASEPTGVDALSDRELEVFGLLARAATTRDIAERLGLSVKTIESHRENIKAKLGLRNNNELIRRAVEWWLQET